MKKRLLFAAKLAIALLALGIVAFAAQIPDENALNSDNPRVREMIMVQDVITPDLMAMDDVLGTAVGQDDDGELAILVFVNLEGKNPSDTIRNIPQGFLGKRVKIEMTEPFRAMAKKGGGSTPTVSHTAKQTPPIQLGTSGGWRYDLANGYCCGGTLGALISKGGNQYILSNYHVFESDIVPGGNNRTATTGDPVIQPGLIDVGCSAGNAQNVATLETHSSLPGSNVDASIAEVIPGMVKADGSILEIGTLSASTVAAYVNQPVKKSGRTTKLTRSTVAALNMTVNVAYDNECAGGAAFTKTFTGQIVINNLRSKFLNSGDSGSLMVEDVSTNPRAVGLLYAGSSRYAIANPINQVLSFFGATMVGN